MRCRRWQDVIAIVTFRRARTTLSGTWTVRRATETAGAALWTASHLAAKFLQAFQLFLAQGRTDLRKGAGANQRALYFQFGKFQGFFADQLLIQLFREEGLIDFATKLHELLIELTILFALGGHFFAEFLALFLCENRLRRHAATAS